MRNEMDWLDLTNADLIPSGDQLRNINCFEYLNNIASALFLDCDTDYPETPAFLPLRILKRFYNENSSYNTQYPFGDLYTDFLYSLEKNIDAIMGASENNPALYDKMAILLHCIYVNKNNSLMRSANMVQRISDNACHTSEEIVIQITARLSQDRTRVNKISPQDADTTFAKIKNVGPVIVSNFFKAYAPSFVSDSFNNTASYLQSDYKPMFITRMPTVCSVDSNPLELSMGTQGQYQGIEARVNPLFKWWLKTREKTWMHVYINNLGLDRTDREGIYEKDLTLQLQALELYHPNIIVITLPADKGFLDVALIEQHHKTEACDTIFKRLLSIPMGLRTEAICDFWMSKKTERLIYADHKEMHLSRLLTESFNELLNIASPNTSTELISPAEIQAVYFHFIKFKLTDFILQQIKHDSVSTACKDAIDRANAAVLYRRILKSIFAGKPLSRAEFYCGLHAAATMVKGRGMNHHTLILWNALHFFIVGNSKLPIDKQKVIPHYLIEWRNKHAPINYSARALLLRV